MPNNDLFRTNDGQPVPAITAAEMKRVDDIAVADFGLSILQMMENAGRTLAEHALRLLGKASGSVTILAGGGGNGGGGLACARHLANHGVSVSIILDRPAADLRTEGRKQLEPLRGSGIRPSQRLAPLRKADLLIDALIGYGLRSAPAGRTRELIRASDEINAPVLSLDLPSGLDATTGLAPGDVVQPSAILTLALPKTGLRTQSADIFLADLGIPPRVFALARIPYHSPFGSRSWIPVDLNRNPK